MSDFGITWSAHLPQGTTPVPIPGDLSSADMVWDGGIITGPRPDMLGIRLYRQSAEVSA